MLINDIIIELQQVRAELQHLRRPDRVEAAATKGDIEILATALIALSMRVEQLWALRASDRH